MTKFFTAIVIIAATSTPAFAFVPTAGEDAPKETGGAGTRAVEYVQVKNGGAGTL